LSRENAEELPQILSQTENFLTYLHLNSVSVSASSGTIGPAHLKEIVRLFDPAGGQQGYHEDERFYPRIYFVDTLCRFSALTLQHEMRLRVSQCGYLFLARAAPKRLLMLFLGFVKDYPWFLLFPRGEFARQMTDRRDKVVEHLMGLAPQEPIGLAEFAAQLCDATQLRFEHGSPPYSNLVVEWVVRNILVQPLAWLGVFDLFSVDGQRVSEITQADQIALSARGHELLHLREVRYARQS